MAGREFVCSSACLEPSAAIKRVNERAVTVGDHRRGVAGSGTHCGGDQSDDGNRFVPVIDR